MINGLNGLGNTALYSEEMFFESTATDPELTFKLSPLKSNTQYKLYYVIGNEDPFETIELGSV